jgi:hypothetical protein
MCDCVAPLSVQLSSLITRVMHLIAGRLVGGLEHGSALENVV